MLMSKADYAKHRGVSRQTVYSWIERGEVVMSGNKIDVAATEHQQQVPKPTDGAASFGALAPEGGGVHQPGRE